MSHVTQLSPRAVQIPPVHRSAVQNRQSVVVLAEEERQIFCVDATIAAHIGRQCTQVPLREVVRQVFDSHRAIAFSSTIPVIHVSGEVLLMLAVG
jgi:hypothetical protein